MSYILLINPLILEDAGLDKKRTAIATAVTSCVATLISGVIGNLPFGISPGMGVNTMFALTHVSLYIDRGFVKEQIVITSILGQNWRLLNRTGFSMVFDCQCCTWGTCHLSFAQFYHGNGPL